MYLLKQGNKTLSLKHYDRHYIVGFKTDVMARKVHYSIHPEPKLIIVRDENVLHGKILKSMGLTDMNLNLDVNATLFIPKCKGSTLEPMNDGGFHLSKVSYESFLLYPFVNNVGIIMPYKLEEENEYEFMFKAQVIDPHM